MKRGRPGIKPSISRLIAEKALGKKNMPRLALAVELGELIEKMGEIRPAEETIIRRISQARNHPKNPFDELWSLSSLVEYPIPPEAMPAVMSAYKKALAEKDELTIREAQWIARLYNVIDPPHLLRDWAWAYATEEWISAITNQPFNTEELDSKLISDIYYAQRSHSESKRETDIWGIAEKYSPWETFGADFDRTADLFNKLIDLNLSIEQTEEIAKSSSKKYDKEAQHERSHSQEVQE